MSTIETDPLDRKPVVSHPDAEASNALANYVSERMYPYVHRGHTLFSARYGIAGDFLHWLDEHRPRWNDTRTVAQVKAEALREFRATVADLRRVPGGSHGPSVKGAAGSERREAVERFVAWILSADFEITHAEVVDELEREDKR